ncbi:glycosyltransferase [Corallococcus exercitus]|uniref:Glycosyltransferase n=1 Tax=Corallococcus exercitus TaxID=2316736 RepID=A0A3A8HG92_9BACT|nr:glycosyltransferase [Corallococcus exercitus]NOK39408.1 glycosyltransferase [Corallococcus exercitus]RKG64931.1 glycosyltransferase [Corallococcus exercitus]
MDIVFLGPVCRPIAGAQAGTAPRQLAKALRRRGHAVLVLERGAPGSRSEASSTVATYQDLADLHERFHSRVRHADLVLVDADVPQVADVSRWATNMAAGLTVFWDRDTPRTLARHALREDPGCMTPELFADYRLYLCSSGGPVPRQLEREWGVARARVFLPGVDTEFFTPGSERTRWDLGHLGPLSAERWGLMKRWLLGAARGWSEGRFVLAGMVSAVDDTWPTNVARHEVPSPGEHAGFLGAQRFTLALSQAEHTPGANLFEAAACGAALICDTWPGLEDVFALGEEVMVAHTERDVLRYLLAMPEADRRQLGVRARARVLAEHTVAHRAVQLEQYANEADRGAAWMAPVRSLN